MISFTKKTWKDRSAGAAQGVDPAVSAVELQRHEDALDALVKKAYDTVYDGTLGADAASFNVTGLDLTGLLAIDIFFEGKLTGTHSPHYGHTYIRFNGDTAASSYAYSIKNSDASTDSGEFKSVIGGTLPGTIFTSDAIMIGHAPTSDGVANQYGTSQVRIQRPGDNAKIKNVDIEHQMFCGNFTNYADLNPIGMRGAGFWKGPGAITQVTIVPEFNLIAAGARMTIKAVQA